MIEERRIQTGKLSTFSLFAGSPSAPPIILLHGAGPGANAAANWYPIMEDLGQKFYVIAPDLVGFGQTDVPQPWPTHILGWIGERVVQVLSLMDALGIERTHLVGNSMGGALALDLMCEERERFGDSILMGSIGAPFERSPELERLLAFYVDPRPARFRQVIESFAYEPSTFVGIEALIESRYAVATDPKVRGTYEEMFGSMQGGMDSLIVSPIELGSLPQRILIFHGRNDRIIPLETSLYLLRSLQHAELVVLDRCGHWAQLQRWDMMLPLIERHLGLAAW